MTPTADLLDQHPDAGVCQLQFRSFGAPAFSGPAATVRCREDNVLLKQLVEEAGDGRVIVVDGAGSLRCALLGDTIARRAKENGWAGIIVNGCVRDTAALDELGLGVKALGTNPRPSRKEGQGETDVGVTFGGATFAPGAIVHADLDGVVVLPPDESPSPRGDLFDVVDLHRGDVHADPGQEIGELRRAEDGLRDFAGLEGLREDDEIRIVDAAPNAEGDDIGTL